MSFPDLPVDYDRHRTELDIVDPGASNPSGIALALHDACRQAIAEGLSQRDDPAIRLIGLQLASLLNVDRILDADEYSRLVEECLARAKERENARLREYAARARSTRPNPASATCRCSMRRRRPPRSLRRLPRNRRDGLEFLLVALRLQPVRRSAGTPVAGRRAGQ